MTQKHYDFKFLGKEDEIISLLKEIEWSEHPLGPPANWPANIKAVLASMMRNKFASVVYWGPELHCLYNHSFSQSLGSDGRHPSGLATPGSVLFKESWKDVGPMVQSVMKGGESTFIEDAEVPLYRNGKEEITYWTFSQSAILDEQGEPIGVLVNCVEKTDKLLQLEERKTNERRLQMLADSVSHLIWIGGDTGLRSANKALIDFSGLGLEGLKGTGWLKMIHPDDQEENERLWMTSLETGAKFEMEHRFQNHEGDYKWFFSTATPHFDKNGEIDMWMGVSADIDSIKKEEKKKDVFIAMASHELRTPVTTIKGYVELLSSVHESSEDKFLTNTLSTLNRQVDSLSKLISGMLDLSRLEMGKMDYQIKSIDLVPLLRQSIDDLALVHPDHDFELICPNRLTVAADSQRIGQVITNFLTNAIKYAPQSKKVVLRVEEIEDRVKVSVRDFGIGLREPDRKKVFKRFFRVEGEKQTAFAGFGIGLHIASDIIHRHGGEIAVDSTYGEGSTFYFIIPKEARPNGE